MKSFTIFTSLFIFITGSGCVQHAQLKTVIATLSIKNQKNVGAVSIRGSGNPLSWESDYPMKTVIKDSVYTATFNSLTAFQYTELKFIVDGKWELEGQPNRKLFYDAKKDTVYINVIYNQP